MTHFKKPKVETEKVETVEKVEAVESPEKKNVNNAARPRLHYKLTTTGADAIVIADASPDEWEPLMVEQQEKVAILGASGLQHSERSMNPTDPVLLFSGEKNQRVWEELLHHLRITSATVMSPGLPPYCGRA